MEISHYLYQLLLVYHIGVILTPTLLQGKSAPDRAGSCALRTFPEYYNIHKAFFQEVLQKCILLMQYKSNLLHKFITSRQGYPRHMYFGDVMLSVLQNQKLTKFIKSVLLLTGTAIIMRAVSVYFNVYLTGKLGEEGIGLFTLVTSVYSFAITFATSAVNLASTRLVSEALGTNSHMAVRSYMRKCICYSMAFGFGASFLLFSLAPAIGIKLLGDQRTVTSLRFFALTLPCIALSSCLNGYFTAVRRVAKNAAVQFCEQSVRIGVCVFLLTFFNSDSFIIC